MEDRLRKVSKQKSAKMPKPAASVRQASQQKSARLPKPAASAAKLAVKKQQLRSRRPASVQPLRPASWMIRRTGPAARITQPEKQPSRRESLTPKRLMQPAERTGRRLQSNAGRCCAEIFCCDPQHVSWDADLHVHSCYRSTHGHFDGGPHEKNLFCNFVVRQSCLHSLCPQLFGSSPGV